MLPIRLSVISLLVFLVVACSQASQDSSITRGPLQTTLSVKPKLIVTAVSSGALDISVARDGREILVHNCNGAVTWGLADPASDGAHPAWVAKVDACLSPPIVLNPAQPLQLDLLLDPSTPNAGLYRVVLYGVRYAPNMEPVHLLSDPVNLPAR